MHSKELHLFTVWVEGSLACSFSLLGSHTLEVESVHDILRDVWLEVIQNRSLPL